MRILLEPVPNSVFMRMLGEQKRRRLVLAAPALIP